MPLDNISPQCRCGRPLSPPHCPRCGSSSTYGLVRANAYSTVEQVLPNGKVYPVRVVVAPGLKCRKCGHGYNTTMMCEAPLSKDFVKQQQEQAAIEIGSAIAAKLANPEERLAALQDLFRDTKVK